MFYENKLQIKEYS